MKIEQLFEQEDAVSPVIGVILMVAITVILAAVIGTFVLGLGENVQDSAPQANFQFEYENISTASSPNAVEITHTGGEDVEASTVEVLIGSNSVYNSSSLQQDASGGSADDLNDTSASMWGSTISTGSSARFEENLLVSNDDIIVSGRTVRVVWTSPSGGTSNTIGQSTVPN